MLNWLQLTSVILEFYLSKVLELPIVSVQGNGLGEMEQIMHHTWKQGP